MKIIGIDLGTTNSCVYYLDDEGVPRLVMPQKRYKFFPSVVWSAGAGKEIVVGHAAKSRLGSNPPPVVAVKRKMGTTESVMLGGRAVSPVDVSVHILSYARQLVEEATGDQVGGVVVTVPAYFSQASKHDTYLAAAKAFFDGDEGRARGRIELQLEPEAAAYAYGAEDPTDRLRLLVYDLGGGTFDVTVLEKAPDTGLTAIKFGGDAHLGGDNVDDRVALWLLYLLRGGNPQLLARITEPGRYDPQQVYALLQRLMTGDFGAAQRDLRPADRDLILGPNPPYDLDLDPENAEDQRRIQTLKRLAEQAKHDLTQTEATPISRQGAFEDHAGNLVDIDFTLQRVEFDLLVGDMIARTIECTRRVIAESNYAADDFDRVLLVGGSSRMPIVKEELSKLFRCPILEADPDLIVARGAALRARALNVRPLDAADAKLQLEFPRETPDDRVTIRGVLVEPLPGHAFLLQGQSEVDHAPISTDRFQFRDVSLVHETDNHFRVEVTDAQETLFASAEISIRHSHSAAVSADRLAPKITQAIRALSTRGYHTLFPEGEVLPATRKVPCFRATQDDYIEVELYEGERWLTTIRIDSVDPSLPVGAAIDLDLTISSTYSVSATATIRDTQQSQSATCEITPLSIPSLAVMDRDKESTMAQIRNDLEKVRDANRRLALFRKVTRLESEYTKARSALTLDSHKLFTTIGELRTALMEIRSAHTVLEPPIAEVLGLCNICRSLVGRLPEQGAVQKQDVLERLANLERAAQSAYEREDEAEYKQIFNELRKLHEGLEQASNQGTGGAPARRHSAFDLHRALMGWLAELREKVAEHDLAQEFGGEIDAAQSAARAIELRDEERAQTALLTLVDRQVKPLDHKIDRAIEAKGGRSAPSRAKISF